MDSVILESYTHHKVICMRINAFRWVYIRRTGYDGYGHFLDFKKWLGKIFFESLILAQDERWRRALSMQVERSDESQGLSDSRRRVSNA